MSECSAETAPIRVSVVIPNLDGARWLPGCLEGLRQQDYRGFETIVVDNGSTDGSPDLVRQHCPSARLVALGRNLGFAGGVNAGIASARGEYVALLNTDTVPRSSWLGTLVRTLDALPADVGGVAPRLLRLDDPDTVDDAGNALSWTGAARKLGHGEPRSAFAGRGEVFALSGAASLFRRSFLEAMRGLDEAFFAYLEDVDLGLRGRICGYRFLLEPTAEVLHEGHGSGISRGLYVRLVTRNRLMLFGKSVPLRLLLRNLGRLVYGQVYFLLAYRRPLDTLRGYSAFLVRVPHVLRERRRLMPAMRIPAAELQRLLEVDMGEPPLREILARRVGRHSP